MARRSVTEGVMDWQKALSGRSLLLDVLKQRLKVSTVSYVRMTEQSKHYRRRAQQLALKADATTDETETLRLVHEALSWVQLAENEEALSDARSKPAE